MTEYFGANRRNLGMLQYLIQGGQRRRRGHKWVAIEQLEIRTLLSGNSPVIAINQSFGVLSSSVAGTEVGTVIATDFESDPLTYAIASGNEVGAFEINPTSGKITVNNQSLLNALTTETVLSIKVSETANSVNSDTKNVTILLNRVPIINDAQFAVPSTIAAGDTIGTITGTDPDSNQTLSYFITKGNESGAFAIGTTTGKITILNKAAFDNLPFPAKIEVEARDTGTSPGKNIGTDIAKVTINLNLPPLLEGNEFFILSIAPQNFPVGTVQTPTVGTGVSKTYRFSAGNDGAFAISNTGAITVVNTSLLNVLGSTVDLTVEVTDTASPASAKVPVKIHLNRPPVIDEATFIVKSDFIKGEEVGIVMGHDSDLATTPEGTLSYFLTKGNDSGAFAINATTGKITVANKAAFDALVFPVTLQAEVRDGGDLAKGARGTATADISIVLDGPPVVSGQILFLLTQDTATYHMGSTPVRLDPKAIFRLGDGVENSFTDSTLTVSVKAGSSGVKSGKLFVVSDGPGSGHITAAGKSILYGDTVVGTFVRSDAGTTMVIHFNQSTTAASIQAMLKRIGLKAGAAPSDRHVELTFQGVPALGEQTSQIKTVNIVKHVRAKK